MFSACSVIAKNAELTHAAGRSLALSLYDKDLTMLLTGDLGAGKTTFAQGLASGLGISDRVLSPTYALEQRYDGFTHIDLYRLNEAQATAFLRHSEDVQGIRLIEWAERIDAALIGRHIHVHIADRDGEREIQCHFLDHAVPTDAQIEKWRDIVRLPPHIRRHCDAVTRVADTLAQSLIEKQHRIVRTQALHAAAMAHDLLRFVDFKTWNGDALYSPADEDRHVWQKLKDKYGFPHEDAANKLLSELNFPMIGEIVLTHKGADMKGIFTAKTVEQQLLAYADKRVAFEDIVTIDERFDDFIKRYGAGKEGTEAKAWRDAMKQLERELFPDGVPKL